MDKCCPDAVLAAQRVVQIERTFLTQSVSIMLDRGIRQFLDLGCGKPGVGSPHDMGRLAGSAIQVVHVDHDPKVIEQTRLAIGTAGARHFLCHDVIDVASLIDTCHCEGMLDAARPTGVVAVGLLHVIPPKDRPCDLLARYSSELAPDSMFAASHLGPWFADCDCGAASDYFGGPVYLRREHEIAAMFDGLVLMKPGVVALPHEWGAHARPTAGAPVFAGIAVKR